MTRPRRPSKVVHMPCRGGPLCPQKEATFLLAVGSGDRRASRPLGDRVARGRRHRRQHLDSERASATSSVANPTGSLALLGPTTGQFQPPFDVSKRSQRPPAELSSSRYCSANRRNGSVHYQVRIPLGSPDFLNNSAGAFDRSHLISTL